jgi:hypothetical protein
MRGWLMLTHSIRTHIPCPWRAYYTTVLVLGECRGGCAPAVWGLGVSPSYLLTPFSQREKGDEGEAKGADAPT